ncbi:MAG: AbrB family transcriptional regulator [Nanohaloarchaea archaeon SW_7_43_1]|nr:MAG: AbrB family transcriptional regulator [Nanohaloarchaea archaeon SW_7_43_1]
MVAEDASVTSKGQVTIPKNIRSKLGIGSGSKVSFILRDGEVVMIPKSDNPLEEMREMRSEIAFSKKEIDDMIEESNSKWADQR